MKTCKITECPKPVFARQMCKKHYTAWNKYGDPLTVKKKGPPPKPMAELFWAKVNKTETCWLWTGASASKYGHGKFMRGDKNLKAHRVAWELLIGPIPEGMTIDHLCRVPACVNPAHLEPVTLAENVRRQGAAKTHCPQGHPLSGDNLYRNPRNGHRMCRTCRRAHDRNSKAKRRNGGIIDQP